MATIAFTEFLPEILPSVPGCADILALNAIRNACIEFCSNTMYWQEEQDTVSIQPTDTPYDLEAPSGARVIQPLAVAINGKTLTARSIDWLDNNVVGWRAATSTVPTIYYQPNPNQIVLVPTPVAAVNVDIRVAYCPKRSATTIEEYVYQNYLEGIASGALARLTAIPGQPWTNQDQSAYHRNLFNNAMVDATIEANKAYNRGGMQVKMRSNR